MLKKVTILAATLMLLLATAQLAVAQQDIGTSQPVQDEQAAAPDTEQQDASQTQPAGEAQAASPSLEGVAHLNENNNLIVNCAGVSEGLAQLQQLGEAQASDPQFQSTLAQAEMLAQLCASSGYTPSSAGEPSGSNSTGASPEQTQQSG
jgi:hypothetical protein